MTSFTLLTLGLLAGLLLSAEGRIERKLADAVSGVVDGAFDDDESTDAVYQQVSASTGGLSQTNSVNGWSVSFVNATLELTTYASFNYSYKANNGTSRFNVTTRLMKASSGASANPPQILARIQTVDCGSTMLESNFLLDNSSQSLAPLQIVGTSNTSITNSQTKMNSTVYNLLVDYDLAQSVGIYADQNLIACQNIDAPFPDFPRDWSATIENTDVLEGRTFVYEEQFSQSLNKIRLNLHGFGQDRIILTDASSSTNTFINPQNGSCTSRHSRQTRWITGQDNVTLLSTADILHFSDDQFSYVPGIYDVRGIACELWQADVEFENNWANASFTASFYFPVNQWLVAREDYHRLLKQIVLNGSFNDEAMEVVISYVNFRPRTFVGPTFDVCAISPYGSNCNCTDASRKAAFSNITNLDEGDDLSTTGDLQAACKYGASIPHGFVSAQSGPYVGLTIIGMIGGALITGLAMFFIYRRRTGVMITDNFSHEKFRDAPGS